ncbi:MAG: O-antigen ligase family protein [Acidimicrobiales bacterium]
MAIGAAPLAAARALDVAGIGLAVASVGWTLWTGRSGRGDPLPLAGLQCACAVTYVAARAAARWQRPLVPVTVVAGVASALVLGSVVPSLAPLSPPLGYANANAALYVLAAVAAVMAAAAFPPGPATAIALPVGVAFALAAVVSGSITGVVVLCLAVLVLAARAAGWVREPVIVCAVVLQAVVAVTAFVGVAQAVSDQPTTVGWAGRLVDDRRVVLWKDAAVIARHHPLDGAGPGSFREVSPTARADPDARWAHSGFLQQAAEEGAVGLLLMLAVFWWGFARLWWATLDTFTLFAAVAMAALGLHASVDYVLHFPAVPLTAAALVGAASPSRREGPG